MIQKINFYITIMKNHSKKKIKILIEEIEKKIIIIFQNKKKFLEYRMIIFSLNLYSKVNMSNIKIISKEDMIILYKSLDTKADIFMKKNTSYS